MEKFHLNEFRSAHIIDSIKKLPKEEKTENSQKIRATCKWFIKSKE